MILVDVYIPAVNQRYDFKLDEYAPISEITVELGEMILSLGDETMEEMVTNLLLCSCDARQVLPQDQNLYQCGIGSGSHLLLI